MQKRALTAESMIGKPFLIPTPDFRTEKWQLKPSRE